MTEQELLRDLRRAKRARTNRSASLPVGSKEIEQILRDVVSEGSLAESLSMYLEEVVKMAKRNGWNTSNIRGAIDALWR